MSIENGGSAFPCPGMAGMLSGEIIRPEYGMSLRDYSAIHAAVSWTEAADTFVKKNNRDPTVQELADYVAEIRYLMADAMLRAREQQS